MRMSNIVSINSLKALVAVTVFSVSLTGCEDEKVAAQQSAISSAPSISQGRATPIDPPILDCDVPGWRITAQGEVQDNAGNVWRTPADVAYVNGPKATDLFNECNNVTLANADALPLEDIPLTELDADGEIITTYFFGDNYAEIFVNGELIGVDPVPYWPFNTAAVRFKVKRPFTLGAKLVDWEENLNLGSELMRGVPYHNGDGGFVAVVKDEAGETIAITDDKWRVQFYYASPLLDPDCFTSVNGARSSEQCASPEKANAEQSYAARWPVPADWATPEFDDSSWPYASLYTNEDIGGSLRFPGDSDFTGLYDRSENDAQFIWSSNLLLDNLVLARRTIE